MFLEMKLKTVLILINTKLTMDNHIKEAKKSANYKIMFIFAYKNRQ